VVTASSEYKAMPLAREKGIANFPILFSSSPSGLILKDDGYICSIYQSDDLLLP